MMKKNHPSEKTRLLFLLDELSGKKRKAVETHFSHCQSCRKQMDDARRLIHLIRQYPETAPDAASLTRCRNRLIRAVRQHTENTGRRGITEDIRNRLQRMPAAPTWALALAMFAAGLFTGKALFHESFIPDLPFNINAVESPLAASEFRILPAEDNGSVKIRFRMVQDKMVVGRITDPGMQELLAFILIHASEDHTRLKVMHLLAEVDNHSRTAQALLYAMENDSNPGVRLKAVKIMSSIPMNDTVKGVLLRVLFKDSNEGVQVRAAEALHQTQDPEILARLKNQSGLNQYTRSLFARNTGEPLDADQANEL